MSFGRQYELTGFISYFSQNEQYNSERGVTRQYANQKVWPRAVFVRRARYAPTLFIHYELVLTPFQILSLCAIEVELYRAEANPIGRTTCGRPCRVVYVALCSW